MQPPDDNRAAFNNAEPRSPQSGSRALLLLATIVALLLIALLTQADDLFAAVYLITVGFVFYVAVWTILVKRQLLIPFLLLLTALLLLTPVLMRGASPAAREAGRRAVCLNNLKNLGAALKNYVAVKDSLPPVFTQDSNGQPLMSWRTRILPFIERSDIYSRYELKEPWNSTTNGELARVPIELFRCPSDVSLHDNQTNYVAILAPGSAWQPGRGTKLADIKDNLADTLLLVELKNSGIGWAEPRDLDLNNLPPGITQQNLLTSLSNHPGHFNALFADGHVEPVPTTIPWSDFLALITIAGGEKIDRSKW